MDSKNLKFIFLIVVLILDYGHLRDSPVAGKFLFNFRPVAPLLRSKIRELLIFKDEKYTHLYLSFVTLGCLTSSDCGYGQYCDESE